MTDGGEIEILIVIKSELSIIKVVLKYFHICSLFSYYLMIELKGNLTALHY